MSGHLLSLPVQYRWMNSFVWISKADFREAKLIGIIQEGWFPVSQKMYGIRTVKLIAPMDAPVIIADYSQNQFKLSKRSNRVVFSTQVLDLFVLTQHRFVKYKLELNFRIFLGAFAKLRKATVSLLMSVRPSAWNNSAPIFRIFMKFDIWGFSEDL